jgi:hypothetical protein
MVWSKFARIGSARSSKSESYKVYLALQSEARGGGLHSMNLLRGGLGDSLESGSGVHDAAVGQDDMDRELLRQEEEALICASGFL